MVSFILRLSSVGVVAATAIIIAVAAPYAAYAQTAGSQVIMRATVLSVEKEEIKTIPGTDTTQHVQTLSVKITDGLEKGKIVTVANDYIHLAVGDSFYVTHTVDILDDVDRYTISDPYRISALMWLTALFVLCVVIFGGVQGARGLVALSGSIGAIVFILLPGILAGHSPILISLFVAALITTIGSYITHGFTRTTTTAVVGMIITVAFVGVLSYVVIPFTHLSGFGNDEAVYLNLGTRGHIDFAGLLLGGILIGLLGVLYDAAIGQAMAVEELCLAAPHYTRTDLFKRALRLGREHVGALVNTLAIAYVGASLPLFLLFYSSATSGFLPTINREVFSEEIVRILIGGIGVVLAVPITTFISVWVLSSKKGVCAVSGEHGEMKDRPHHHHH